MGAVNKYIDAAFLDFADDPLDRQHHAGLAGHVIDQQQPCPRRNPFENGLHHRVLARQREPDRSDHNLCAALRCDGVDGVSAGVVLVIGHQQLVSRLQPEAAKDRVDAGRRVHDECKVSRSGTKKSRQNGARTIERRQVVVIEEEQRFALDLQADARLLVKHDLGGCTERTVVEEHHIGIQEPAV